MSTSDQPLAAGTYKFLSRSTEEAVAVIRERLGTGARVISVRTSTASGLRRYFCRPRLEITVQVDGPDHGAGSAGRGRLELSSSEAARPADTSAVASRRITDPVASDQAENITERPASPAADLGGLLSKCGLSPAVIARLQTDAQWSQLSGLPLHRAFAETSRLLLGQAKRCTEPAPLTRAAFIGAAGVGRTTVLCKLLAQEVFRRGRMGHVVAVEFDRPNPLGPLPVFSEALGVPLAHFPCATRPATAGGFVFIDLPPITPLQGRSGNAALAEFLDREAIQQRVLVLNAANDRAALREAHATGRALGATHLVFTHLDEVPRWGKLWDYVFDEALEPLLLATGPSLTGDCEEDVRGAIARRTLPDARCPE